MKVIPKVTIIGTKWTVELPGYSKTSKEATYEQAVYESALCINIWCKENGAECGKYKIKVS